MPVASTRKPLAPSSSTRNAAPPPQANPRHSVSSRASLGGMGSMHSLSNRHSSSRLSLVSGEPTYSLNRTSSVASTLTNLNANTGVSANEDTIRVFVRIRPLNQNEERQGQSGSIVKVAPAASPRGIDDDDITPIPTHLSLLQAQTPKTFGFDGVFGEDSNQSEIYDVVGRPVVDYAMTGYNGSVYVYGQTGAGKTFTMQGPVTSAASMQDSPMRGLMFRLVEDVFERISSGMCKEDEFLCKCSYLEIYKESVTDLFSPARTNLQIREDMKRGVYVEGLEERVIWSASETMSFLKNGLQARHVAATASNDVSSRSHAVFTITIESRFSEAGVTSRRLAKINLIDLAGSERQQTIDNEQSRVKEAGAINKSLAVLTSVIQSLSKASRTHEGKSSFVHFRDSKLTFLLRDSLGGNSKTRIVANISRSPLCFGETLSTLKFAARAKAIRCSAIRNEEYSGTVESLQQEITSLKKQLADSRQAHLSMPATNLLSTTPDTNPEDFETFAHRELHAPKRVQRLEQSFYMTLLENQRLQKETSTLKEFSRHMIEMDKRKDEHIRDLMLQFVYAGKAASCLAKLCSECNISWNASPKTQPRYLNLEKFFSKGVVKKPNFNLPDDIKAMIQDVDREFFDRYCSMWDRDESNIQDIDNEQFQLDANLSINPRPTVYGNLNQANSYIAELEAENLKLRGFEHAIPRLEQLQNENQRLRERLSAVDTAQVKRSAARPQKSQSQMMKRTDRSSLIPTCDKDGNIQQPKSAPVSKVGEAPHGKNKWFADDDPDITRHDQSSSDDDIPHLKQRSQPQQSPQPGSSNNANVTYRQLVPYYVTATCPQCGPFSNPYNHSPEIPHNDFVKSLKKELKSLHEFKQNVDKEIRELRRKAAFDSSTGKPVSRPSSAVSKSSVNTISTKLVQTLKSTLTSAETAVEKVESRIAPTPVASSSRPTHASTAKRSTHAPPPSASPMDKTMMRSSSNSSLLRNKSARNLLNDDTPAKTPSLSRCSSTSKFEKTSTTAIAKMSADEMCERLKKCCKHMVHHITQISKDNARLKGELYTVRDEYQNASDSYRYYKDLYTQDLFKQQSQQEPSVLEQAVEIPVAPLYKEQTATPPAVTPSLQPQERPRSQLLSDEPPHIVQSLSNLTLTQTQPSQSLSQLHQQHKNPYQGHRSTQPTSEQMQMYSTLQAKQANLHRVNSAPGTIRPRIPVPPMPGNQMYINAPGTPQHGAQVTATTKHTHVIVNNQRSVVHPPQNVSDLPASAYSSFNPNPRGVTRGISYGSLRPVLSQQGSSSNIYREPTPAAKEKIVDHKD